jgi:hypothetical protein
MKQSQLIIFFDLLIGTQSVNFGTRKFFILFHLWEKNWLPQICPAKFVNGLQQFLLQNFTEKIF